MGKEKENSDLQAAKVLQQAYGLVEVNNDRLNDAALQAILAGIRIGRRYQRYADSGL